MLHPMVAKLPLTARRRFEAAYSNKRLPVGLGEVDDIVVGLIQAWLVALKFPMPKSAVVDDLADTIMTDGVFGKETHDTVHAFQRGNPPLVADGLVGHDTLDQFTASLHTPFRPAHHVSGKTDVIVKPRPFRCPPGSLICPDRF